MLQQFAGISPCGQRGVIRERSSRADHDRVARFALLVDALPCGCAGDPLARSVRRRGAPIQGRCPLDGDVGPPKSRGRQPFVLKLLGLGLQQPTGHRDAAVCKSLSAAARERAGVADRVENAGDSRGEESDRARAGASGVVAGFKRDDGGEAARIRVSLEGRQFAEGVDFRVWCSHSAMPALRDDGSVCIDQHASDLRILAECRTARRELERAAHDALQLLGGFAHPVLFVKRLRGCRFGQRWVD